MSTTEMFIYDRFRIMRLDDRLTPSLQPHVQRQQLKMKSDNKKCLLYVGRILAHLKLIYMTFQGSFTL